MSTTATELIVGLKGILVVAYLKKILRLAMLRYSYCLVTVQPSAATPPDQDMIMYMYTSNNCSLLIMAVMNYDFSNW